MSSMNYIYDAAMAFRSPGQSALTETATVGELSLDKLVNVRPGSNRNKLGAEDYKLVLNIEAIDFVTTPDVGPPEAIAEEYTLTLETGDAGSTSVVVMTFKPTTTGNYVFPVDAQTIENLDPNRSAVSLKLAAVGDAPSIKLNAWVV